MITVRILSLVKKEESEATLPRKFRVNFLEALLKWQEFCRFPGAAGSLRRLMVTG